METKVCMNSMCGITSNLEWKKGWGLRSGGFADLCYDCGCAYENYIFCETFHSGETGWRECAACNKLLHCGCIVSKFFIELMDYGGVKCMDCRKGYRFSSPSVQIQKDVIPIDLRSTKKDNSGMWFTSDPPKTDNTFSETGKISQFDKIIEADKDDHLKQSPLSLQIKQEELPHFSQKHFIDKYPKTWAFNTIMSDANIQEVLSVDAASTKSSSAMTTSNKSMGSPDWALPASNRPNTGISQVSEINTGFGCPTRVGRPPAEGRIRSQLLPRYWPRITDQELQRLSGDLNSTIVPLFEKVLSASDASRIGRLVLPKACAEAYFPPISQSEGVPLEIVDVKGTEWIFQFRFWPNNNSRMYVLEGVTPCIQSMHLQAGDTVTFSRIDPEGKFVLGFRKAAKPPEEQTVQDFGRRFCDETEDISSENNTLLQTRRRSPTAAENGGCVREKTKSEKTRSRNIGSKMKRLLMPSEDVWELRITWKEAQDMLIPPPSVNPTVVMIENHKFEEYDEPPVFGKTSAYAVGAAGELEQWAQCESCSKWLKVTEGCTCHQNLCDSNRVICFEPEEKKPAESERSYETDSGGKHEQKCNKCMTTKHRCVEKTVEGSIRNEVSGIDLNYDPKWDGGRGSMMGLVRAASLPLEEYMKENGLESLVRGTYQVLPCGDGDDNME